MDGVVALQPESLRQITREPHGFALHWQLVEVLPIQVELVLDAGKFVACDLAHPVFSGKCGSSRVRKNQLLYEKSFRALR